MKKILLCKPRVLLSDKKFWKYTKYCFKENAKILFKNSTIQDLVLKGMVKLFQQVPPFKKILEFQNQKRDYEICTKRKFRKKHKPMMKTHKVNFINKKTNKEQF